MIYVFLDNLVPYGTLITDLLRTTMLTVYYIAATWLQSWRISSILQKIKLVNQRNGTVVIQQELPPLVFKSPGNILWILSFSLINLYYQLWCGAVVDGGSSPKTISVYCMKRFLFPRQYMTNLHIFLLQLSNKNWKLQVFSPNNASTKIVETLET